MIPFIILGSLCVCAMCYYAYRIGHNNGIAHERDSRQERILSALQESYNAGRQSALQFDMDALEPHSATLPGNDACALTRQLDTLQRSILLNCRPDARQP